MAARIVPETLAAIQPQVELLARIYEASKIEGVIPGLRCTRWEHLADSLAVHCHVAEQMGKTTIRLPWRDREGKH